MIFGCVAAVLGIGGIVALLQAYPNWGAIGVLLASAAVAGVVGEGLREKRAALGGRKASLRDMMVQIVATGPAIVLILYGYPLFATHWENAKSALEVAVLGWLALLTFIALWVIWLGGEE